MKLATLAAVLGEVERLGIPRVLYRSSPASG
jgi:hypothetical protein